MWGRDRKGQHAACGRAFGLGILHIFLGMTFVPKVVLTLVMCRCV